MTTKPKINIRFLAHALVLGILRGLPLTLGLDAAWAADPQPEPRGVNPSPTPSILPLSTPSVVQPEEAHPGMAMEADYAEAVFWYTNENYDQSLQLIEKILKSKREHIEALELKAMILKAQGRFNDSKEIYTTLVKTAPPHKKGPYYFELGTLYMQLKKAALSKAFFEGSLKARFNPGPSRYFLGVLALEERSFDEAIRYFNGALNDLTGETIAACRFYLSLAYAQAGDASNSLFELAAAQREALNYPDHPLAMSVASAVEKPLAAYDQKSFFGSVFLSQQYDGNVSSLPLSVTPEMATGKQSFKSNLGLTLGLSTSPVQALHQVLIYRFFGNYNYNPDAKEYNFATNTLTAILTARPLGRVSFGARAEGVYGFQNRENPDTSSYSFQPYSYSGEITPFLVTHLIPHRWTLTAELAIKSQKFNADQPDINQRSGLLMTPNLTFKFDFQSKAINPVLVTKYEFNNAQGSNQRSRTWLVDFTNTIQFRPAHSLALGATFSQSHYPERIPDLRTDQTSLFHANWTWPMGRRFSLNMNASLTINQSTQSENYSYNKQVFDVGFNYAL